MIRQRPREVVLLIMSFFPLLLETSEALLTSPLTNTISTLRRRDQTWLLSLEKQLKNKLVSDDTRLMLSTIPEDSNKDNRGTTRQNDDTDSTFRNAMKELTKNLPPAPENFLVLGGDVAALFTYSFLDHSINSLYEATMAKETAEGIVGLHAAWMDSLPSSFIIATQNYYNHHITGGSYAPALEYPGVSSVLFATCWLLSGYFHQAFSYDNTIRCSPAHAMLVTGRAWIFSCLAMLAIAFLSDTCGSDLQYQVGGLTRADADYIFDSLAVIVTWRYMIATILGRY